PAFHTHTQSADFRFGWSFTNPDPDTALGAMRRYTDLAKRIDHPTFQQMDKTADLFPPPLQVEHNVADPLAWPVIGIAAAAAGLVDGEAQRIDQLGRGGPGGRGEERRVFQEPDAFGRSAF